MTILTLVAVLYLTLYVRDAFSPRFRRASVKERLIAIALLPLCALLSGFIMVPTANRLVYDGSEYDEAFVVQMVRGAAIGGALLPLLVTRFRPLGAVMYACTPEHMQQARGREFAAWALKLDQSKWSLGNSIVDGVLGVAALGGPGLVALIVSW